MIDHRRGLCALAIVTIAGIWLAMPVRAQDPTPQAGVGFPLPLLEVITPENAEHVTYLGTLEGFHDWVSAVAFGPDGALVAASSRFEGVVLIWETQTGELVGTFNDSSLCDTFGNVAFHPDGKRLATTCGVDLRIWNLSDILSGGDIQPVSIFESPPRLFDMVFSPNGAFVAASTYGYGQLAGLLVGNVETGTILYFLEADEICCPVFSPDNAVLAFATGKILISEPQPKLTVHYLDLKTLEEMATPLEGRIVFNADWTLAADIDVGEYGGYPQNTVVRLWDAESGGLIKVLDNYDDDTSHLPIVLAFSPDSRLLVSASIYYPTLIWDTSTFEYSALPIGGASDIEFSADSKLIVVGRAGSGITDFVQLWGVPSEQDG